MELEWDDAKRERNLRLHEVDFPIAGKIFDSPTLTRQDRRKSYGEDRYISIGTFQGDCFVVVWTPRDGARRLISA